VTTIGPRRRDRDTESYVELDGVAIHRFSLTESGGGAAGHVREYGEAAAADARERTPVAKRSAFDVVRACNAPVLLLTAIARRRQGTAMVGPAVFLASDESAQVTAQLLCVDGGWTATGKVPESYVDQTKQRRKDEAQPT
jgi:hypothetical protein